MSGGGVAVQPRTLHQRWTTTEPASFFTFASGALGWDLPASVGIALGERATGRNRPVMAVMGPSSTRCSRCGPPRGASCRWSWVVPPNADYAVLKSVATQDDTPGVPGLDVPGLDVVRTAEGGVTATRAATVDDVRGQLADAAGRSGPTVIEVSISREVPPLL